MTNKIGPRTKSFVGTIHRCDNCFYVQRATRRLPQKEMTKMIAQSFASAKNWNYTLMARLVAWSMGAIIIIVSSL